MHFEEENILDNVGRFLICGNCHKLIGYVNTGTWGKIFCLCKCRGGVVRKIKSITGCSIDENNEEGGALYICGDDYICPRCGNMVFRIYRNRVINAAFHVRCACGAEYSCAKKLERSERRLASRGFSVDFLKKQIEGDENRKRKA